jgi:hypothetical protein
MRRLHRLLLCAGLALLTTSTPRTQDAPVLRPNDHDQLAKATANYFKALDEETGQSKTLEALQKVIDTFDKRKNAQPTLSLVRDWERALTLAMIPSGSGKKGVSNVEFESERYKFKYALSVPKDYAPKGTPFPVLLVIPEPGKKPQEVIDQAWVDPDLKSKLILAVCAMPSDAKAWTEFGDAEAPGGLSVAMRVLSNLRRTYSIDSNRVYVCGMGPGVAVAGRLGASFPHVFAGVIGRGGDISALSAANFRALPTLWTGGGANCTAFSEESEKLGDKNCSIDPGANEAKIWAWMQAHQRVVTPTALRLAPIHPRNGKAYWLSIDRFDTEAKDKPQVEATADRAANKIVVTGSGVELVILYFNDVLVDLSKPVEVVLNGESHKLEIKRSLERLLRGAYDSSDSSRVYTWSESFTLPKAQKSEPKKP